MTIDMRRNTLRYCALRGVMKATVLVLVAAVALNGCAMGGTYSISEPFIAEVSEHRLDANGTFHADGIVYRVIPLNYKPGVTAIGPLFPLIPIMCCRNLDRSGQSFHIALYFHPRSDEFTITPSGVTLEIDGKTFTPNAAGGPLPCAPDESVHTRCMYKEQDLTGSDLSKAVHIRQGSYVLAYPVMTPDPTQSFAIRIAGVRKKGQPISVPQIKFKGASRGFWFPFAGP